MARVGRSAWDELETDGGETTFTVRTGAPIEEAMRRTIAALAAGPHTGEDHPDHSGGVIVSPGPAYSAPRPVRHRRRAPEVVAR